MSPWLPEAEFKSIFSKVPRLTVEIIAVSETGAILMTKREIEPCKGSWHVPGGTVYFGESVEAAVKRIAQSELGFDVEICELLGYIEYPSHYQNGLDTPVGLAFKVRVIGDVAIRDDAQWFTELPKDMHADQDEFLVDIGLIKRGPESSVFSHDK